MKKATTLILIILTTLTVFSNPTIVKNSLCKTVIISGIEDGWYKATVKYTNYSTGTNSTYILNVKVNYGSVAEIDFGNGGSIHSGYNNEGYIYTGGYLSYETDYNGNIIVATATVAMSDTNGIRYFKIRIE